MNDAELDAIQARADAATPGRWSTHADDSADVYGVTMYDVGTAESLDIVASGGFIETGGPSVGACTKEDAEFIAHARDHVPALVEALRDAQARNEQNERKLAGLTHSLLNKHEECESKGHQARTAEERAAGLAARIAAVEQLCDAADEASLRPSPVNFDPIDVPWTVAVRVTLAGSVPVEDAS